MSYEWLLSPERRDFVRKVYNEMHNNVYSAFPTVADGENRKVYFLQLVNGNKQLSEKEKEYCRERYIYESELDNALYKQGKPVECRKCKSTRYSDRFCENCISLHLQSLFNTWTSGNEIVDNFIQKCQMMSSLPDRIIEWIPYDQFKDVKKLTEGGFSTVKNVQWYHLYVSRGLIKPIKSAFINKSNTKFSCPISLIKNVTKTNIKILIRDIYP